MARCEPGRPPAFGWRPGRLHCPICFSAAMRKMVEAMKLPAATSWAAASAKPFTSMLPVLTPARLSTTDARPITLAQTVRLAKMDFVSVMVGPFCWMEGEREQAAQAAVHSMSVRPDVGRGEAVRAPGPAPGE